MFIQVCDRAQIAVADGLVFPRRGELYAIPFRERTDFRFVDGDAFQPLGIVGYDLAVGFLYTDLVLFAIYLITVA